MWCHAARIRNLGWPRLLCRQAVVYEPVDLTPFWAFEMQPSLLDPIHSCTQGQPFCLRHALLSSAAAELLLPKTFPLLISCPLKVHFLKPTAARLTVSVGCTYVLQFFYVPVTVLHRNKFLCNKTNQMHQFPKFIFTWNSTCFGQFLCPSSGVYSLYTQQW